MHPRYTIAGPRTANKRNARELPGGLMLAFMLPSTIAIRGGRGMAKMARVRYAGILPAPRNMARDCAPNISNSLSRGERPTALSRRVADPSFGG